jgi:hypothetical protein
LNNNEFQKAKNIILKIPNFNTKGFLLYKLVSDFEVSVPNDILNAIKLLVDNIENNKYILLPDKVSKKTSYHLAEKRNDIIKYIIHFGMYKNYLIELFNKDITSIIRLYLY